MTADKQQSLFVVDETSDLPIWVQLRNRFAYLIRTGHFKPGEQLPSVRSLAADAKINYNTVTKAYRDLELENLIVSVRGRGMYVQKNVPDEAEPAEVAIDVQLEDCIRQYRALGLTYEDIEARFDSIAQDMADKTAAAQEERMEYTDEG